MSAKLHAAQDDRGSYESLGSAPASAVPDGLIGRRPHTALILLSCAPANLLRRDILRRGRIYANHQVQRLYIIIRLRLGHMWSRVARALCPCSFTTFYNMKSRVNSYSKQLATYAQCGLVLALL
ncbi:hypothetical protein PsYK624_042670 [Phanerochaete sordida]|uniref:Uncharacterized protein n=1 Tax=Phanerochaete sordida TaxID=48140 RepID=A0A9P3G5E1_9APHY|nr:hypothetical protein PsYK624_042670 [Phanerochaete sordida]